MWPISYICNMHCILYNIVCNSLQSGNSRLIIWRVYVVFIRVPTLYLYIILAGLPGVARAFTTLKYYVYHVCPRPPRCTPKFSTPPRPVLGRPRPTCKVSALYLENCANASRQTETETETETDRQTILFIDIDIPVRCIRTYCWHVARVVTRIERVYAHYTNFKIYEKLRIFTNFIHVFFNS